MTTSASRNPRLANPAAAGAVTMPRGFRAGLATAGIKESGEPDLALLASETPAAAAAVFTKSQTKAAPLHVSAAHLANGMLRAAIINSGNANCATGERGKADAKEMTELAARLVGCAPDEVFVNSTGIIGHFLPMDRIRAGIPTIPLAEDGGAAFARGIMTTDTHPKEAFAAFEANGHRYTVGGCCKGAGMIHPDMATLLAFVTTDAPIDRDILEQRLRHAADRSFNMVSVDGDTSTNDTLLALANGAGGGPPIAAGDSAAIAAFDEALGAVCRDLAMQVAADGEGATKLIEIEVTGARSFEDARDVARTVSVSPLLKAALSKGDPNWGRVLMAMGRAGVPYDLDHVSVWLEGILVFAGTSTGVPEAEAAAAIADRDLVRIRIDLAAGSEAATAWGCDLTEEYVRFNADYVT